VSVTVQSSRSRHAMSARHVMAADNRGSRDADRSNCYSDICLCEIFTDEQQCLCGVAGQGIGEAIPKIQPAG
jgi:hypothetical protein